MEGEVAALNAKGSSVVGGLSVVEASASVEVSVDVPSVEVPSMSVEVDVASLEAPSVEVDVQSVSVEVEVPSVEVSVDVPPMSVEIDMEASVEVEVASVEASADVSSVVAEVPTASASMGLDGGGDRGEAVAALKQKNGELQELQEQLLQVNGRDPCNCS